MPTPLTQRTLPHLTPYGVFLVLAASLVLSTKPVMAMPGYAENVQNQCRLAGRLVPEIGSPPCQTCHSGNAGNESKNKLKTQGIAYREGRVLATFCPETPPGPSGNHPPQLMPIATPVQAAIGVPIVLNIEASDAEGDRLAITVKKPPKGAKLKQQGFTGGAWRATLSWTPTKKQGNRTYTILIQAKEKGRKPALVTEQSLAIVVNGGEPATPPPPPISMHPVGDRVWLEGEHSGHPGAYRARPAECKTCHGSTLRGTSASMAASDHQYRLDDVGFIQIKAGTEVGCWTCHNGPSGDDNGREDDD